jgi:hypothetical protein
MIECVNVCHHDMQGPANGPHCLLVRPAQYKSDCYVTGALPSAESIHGGLLALGELLMHTGEFLLARCVWQGFFCFDNQSNTMTVRQ